MTLNKNHPARSHAFLSRLHDGELEPGERAHFEAHRAHCKECRDGAADFERALTLFRSSRSSPPPKDLANRVLRKVQAHSISRRTPFGDLFSVDLRWAGAFAAALLVLLVAAPIVLQQQKKQPMAPAEGPIPVALQSRAVPPSNEVARADADAAKPAAPAAQGAGNEQGRLRASQKEQTAQTVKTNEDPLKRTEAKALGGAYANAPQEDGKAKVEDKLSDENQAAGKPASLEKAQAPSAAPAPAQADARGPVSNQNRQLASAPAPQAKAAPEAQGGEGARDQVSVSAEAPILDRPARLNVQPFDALGSPPGIDAHFQSAALNDLRGRSYVIFVDGEGRVTEVREAPSKKNANEEARRREASAAKDKEKDNAAAVSALKSLRFKAGERPRRLLIRIE